MYQRTCFLVDDDEDDREIFIMALENADDSYRCITAKNGIDAVNMINADEAFAPQYIFIDLNMPFMSGKECLQAIRKHPRFKETPVVMYTTSSYERDVEETKQMGASYFLVKPPGITDLTKMLSQILNKNTLPFYITSEDSLNV